MLIYGNNKADHAGHMLQMLKHLHQRGLQVDIDKCKFNITRVKYLGMIVTTNKIEIDTKKVKAIQKWEALLLVKDVQVFLGFANFYWRFIPNFLKKVKPLNKLTKETQFTTRKSNKKIKYEAFQWSNVCQQTFENLKHAFTTASVLAHYDSKLEIWAKTNASDFVIAGVLLQMHSKVLKLVAYFSLQEDDSSQMQLYDLWQKTVSYSQKLQNLEAWISEHSKWASPSVHWLPKSWAFHDNKTTQL